MFRHTRPVKSTSTNGKRWNRIATGRSVIVCFSCSLQESGDVDEDRFFGFSRLVNVIGGFRQNSVRLTGQAMGAFGLRPTETEIVQLRALEWERRGVNAPDLESASTPASQIRSCPDFFAIICRPGLPSLDGQVSINRNCSFKTFLTLVLSSLLLCWSQSNVDTV